MNTKEAIKLIQSEINWCLDHPDETLSHDAQFGFMNGLRQAQYLLRKASQPAQDDHINSAVKHIGDVDDMPPLVDFLMHPDEHNG